MAIKIYHKEELKVNSSIKQWVLSSILLLDIIVIIILSNNYIESIIPNKKIDQDALIAGIFVIFFISSMALLIIYSVGFSFFIDENQIEIKTIGYKKVILEKRVIKGYKPITKKEYYKIISEINKSTKYKTQKIKAYKIGIPNYLIILQNNEKIFFQTRRKSSFEYAMNKMLGK